MGTSRVTKLSLAIVLLTLFAVNSLWANGRFLLSSQSDFSTEDRVFTRNDTLFVKVVAPEIDFTDIKENEFRLKPDDGGEDFRGNVTNLFDGTYVISIDLAATDPDVTEWEVRARIEDNRGRRFRAEAEIKIRDDDDETEVEIKGEIRVVGPNFIVVQLTTVFIDTNTSIVDEQDQAIAFADLKVGQTVEIKAVRKVGAMLVARQIKVLVRADDEVEVKGTIESLGEDTLVVLGKTFKVDANTEIVDDDDNPISFAELSVGVFVEVRAVVQADGSLLATRIKIEDEDEGEIEIEGIITDIGDTTLTVRGTVVIVTESTVIVDEDEQTVAFGDLKVGQRVEIRGVRNPDDTVTATRIELKDRFIGRDKIEITGPVLDIDVDHLTVAAFTFKVDENTTILDEKDESIALSDIKLGFIVKVRAEVQTDRTLLATRIKIKQRPFDRLEIVGPIRSIGENSLVVGGLIFFVSTDTEILDEENTPINFSDLEVGLLVKVRAEVQADRTLLATRIKIKLRRETLLELTGTIETLGTDSLVTSGVTIFVDATTEVFDDDDNRIAFADLQVGLIVKVRAVRQPDGRFLGTKIKVEDRFEDEVEITGAIEEIGDNSITVLGRTFVVTENTVIFDNNNNRITLSEFSVGLTVEVRGDLMGDGTLVAIKIKIEDRNEIVVSGPVDSVAADDVKVLGVEFAVTSETEILGKDGMPLGALDLNVGLSVKVTASADGNGIQVATRIEVQNAVLLSGPISQITASGFLIFETEVLVESNTLVLADRNQVISFSDLRAGQLVEVRGERETQESADEESSTVKATKVKTQESDFTTDIAAPIQDGVNNPRQFTLHQNYPNPFNPSTTIRFEITNAGARAVNTRLRVFNLLGQVVRTLVDEPLQPGVYQKQWHGRDDGGRSLSSGIYLYQLQLGEATQTRRMLLVK
ncbi:T9SS type A sorting domain-containing protein [candidate division KSB1 bacterium]|nr:T9SS type A sorting domain-containing protein [candidate division KSB1 bacterium]NIR71547.1 T9SS type A sorting domain-containing protein [candidate division KSB1 bacterium]NIS26343.1 T9SS type A sorting domain-containing protein [candidate division KSB1 bacterium]NIT73110.1 T9SS type A sorting domain-containing protein [candidate division KSB1 bacterium]NIU27026.1 T9SS type A sorting domain-containing protein [candidate division KSB1 bacterium]